MLSVILNMVMLSVIRFGVLAPLETACTGQVTALTVGMCLALLRNVRLG